MKKMMFTVFMVAALAAMVSAQTLVGGSQSAPADNNKAVVSTSASASSEGSGLDLNIHAWSDARLQSSVRTLAKDELQDAEDAESDAIVIPKLKGEFGVRGLMGSIFYMKAQGFYDIGKTGLSSATFMAGPGAQIGPFAIGANVGTDLTNWKGAKIGLDASWDVISDLTIFAWGNTTINGGKNKIISTAGVWSDGTKDYKAWDAGIGIDCFAIDGLYLGLIGSMYGTNNEYVTKDGNKNTTASEVRAKVGLVQDGRLVYLGVGWRGGDSVITPATKPQTSNEFLFEIGFKLQ